MIFTRQYGANENDILSTITSISLSYMANNSTPLLLKSETVVKFKRHKYEQTYKTDYVNEVRCIPKFSTGDTHLICAIFRCDLGIISFNTARFYTLQVQKQA